MEARQVAAGDTSTSSGFRLGARAADRQILEAGVLRSGPDLARGDRVQVYGGLRYDAAKDLFEDKISPRIAVVFNPSTRLVLRGGLSTALPVPELQ